MLWRSPNPSGPSWHPRRDLVSPSLVFWFCFRCPGNPMSFRQRIPPSFQTPGIPGLPIRKVEGVTSPNLRHREWTRPWTRPLRRPWSSGEDLVSLTEQRGALTHRIRHSCLLFLHPIPPMPVSIDLPSWHRSVFGWSRVLICLPRNASAGDIPSFLGVFLYALTRSSTPTSQSATVGSVCNPVLEIPVPSFHEPVLCGIVDCCPVVVNIVLL